jgi:hypothetical protein
LFSLCYSWQSLIVGSMKFLKIAGKKVMYSIKGPLQMDTLLQFMVVLTRFSNKKIFKSDRHKKNRCVNLDKSFWPCLTHGQSNWALSF